MSAERDHQEWVDEQHQQMAEEEAEAFMIGQGWRRDVALPDDEPEITPLNVAVTVDEMELVQGVAQQPVTIEMTQDHQHVLILEFPKILGDASGHPHVEALGSLLSLAAQTWPSILEQMEAQLS